MIIGISAKDSISLSRRCHTRCEVGQGLPKTWNICKRKQGYKNFMGVTWVTEKCSEGEEYLASHQFSRVVGSVGLHCNF